LKQMYEGTMVGEKKNSVIRVWGGKKGKPKKKPKLFDLKSLRR